MQFLNLVYSHPVTSVIFLLIIVSGISEVFKRIFEKL